MDFEAMDLYRVVVKVRPTPRHPLYWDVQFGHLLVCLPAESPADAVRRACSIVDQLPYDRVGPSVTVHQAQPVSPKPFERCERDARAIGVSLCLVACATGVDEEEFETSDPP